MSPRHRRAERAASPEKEPAPLAAAAPPSPTRKAIASDRIHVATKKASPRKPAAPAKSGLQCPFCLAEWSQSRTFPDLEAVRAHIRVMNGWNNHDPAVPLDESAAFTAPVRR